MSGRDIRDYHTKTETKNLYFLNEQELAGMRCIDCRNPHNRKSFMKFYHKNDIWNLLKEKYETDSKEQILQHIQEIKQIKEQKKQKRLFNKETKKEKRRFELVDALNQYGLSLRSDSKLCQGYIDGTIKESKEMLKWIVERMCQMKYIYEYCDMKNEIENAKEEQVEELNAGYIPDISFFEQAEMNILRRINGYPKIFPWMENNNR